MKKFDYVILFCVFTLTIIGLITLSSASSDIGRIKFGDSYYYLKNQMIYGLGFGIIGFFVGLFFHYRFYKKFAILFLLTSVVLLALPIFTPLGFTSGGASRWLSIGSLTFQTSEAVKILFVLYLAAWLIKKPKLLPFLAIIGAIAVLLLLQPSTGTAVIFVSAAMAMYFVNGAPIKNIAIVSLVGLIAISSVLASSEYRRNRLLGFLNPEQYEKTFAFQTNQALIAIGSGGLTGVGYGQSRIKYSSLPETIGDSIFAVYAEEWGFAGATGLAVLFFVLVYQTIRLARKTSDQFGKLILTGFGFLIGVQAFVNMAAISSLIPLTGVPLPFISYGGTALAAYLTMSGIILNVSKYSR